MKKSHDFGFRVAECKSALPPRLRQVAVLQLSAPGQNRDRRRQAVGRAGRAAAPHARSGDTGQPGIRPRPQQPAGAKAGHQFHDGRVPRFLSRRRVLITGGLGFIGSNLARRLVGLGADILLIDSLIPTTAATFQHRGIGLASRNIADVRRPAMNYLVSDRYVIFNLAGQVSHIDSMRDPHTDLDINCRSQLSLLEACRQDNPGRQVVFAGTRQIYGRPDYLPVDEQHLVRPTDVNGINKVAGEYYHLVYNNVFGVRACALRLTNVYGPRQRIEHNRQGFIGWFLRLAIEGEEIEIFGDGIADCATSCSSTTPSTRSCAPAPTDACNGEVFNLGGAEPISHRARDDAARGRRARGACAFVEWPADKKAIDIGSFYSSSAEFKAMTGWQPAVALRDGLVRTIAFYRAHFDRYVPDDAGAVGLMTRPHGILFMVLKPSEDRAGCRAADRRVFDRGWFVLGPEVEAFETEFAAACGAPHASGSARAPTRWCSRCARSTSDRRRGDHVADDRGFTALAIRMAGRHAGVCRHRPDARCTSTRAAVEAASRRARARSCRCTSTASAADMTAIEAIATRHGLAHRRGLRAGAPGDVGRPTGRHVRRRRRASASIRPRTSARLATAAPRHARCRAGRPAPAAAQRRPDRSLPARRGRRELAARRDTGRGPACATAVSTRMDRPSPAPAARYRAALMGASVAVAPEWMPGHVYHLFTVRAEARDALQAHLAAAGVARSFTTRWQCRHSRRLPICLPHRARRPTIWRRRCCRCRCTRPLPMLS